MRNNHNNDRDHLRTVPTSVSPVRDQVYEMERRIYTLSSELQLAKMNEGVRLKSRQEKVQTLLDEIEKLNIVLRRLNQQNQELQSRVSEVELYYQQHLQNIETQHLYTVEHLNSQIADQIQSIAKLNQLVQQQQNEMTDYYRQIEQSNIETSRAKELIKQSNNQEGEIKRLKQEILQINQQHINEQQKLSNKISQLQQCNFEQTQLLETQEHNKQSEQSQIISDYQQQIVDLNKVVEYNKQQMQQLRKTITLLESNLENQLDSENTYQQLLQKLNVAKEQHKQQELQYDQFKYLQQQELQDVKKRCNEIQAQYDSQLILNQQTLQQNDKLKIMLRNRLDEIEHWKSKSNNTALEERIHTLSQENDILRQKCNILEINIKENSPQKSSEVNQLHEIISKQQVKLEQLQQSSIKKPARYSPKSARYRQQEPGFKELHNNLIKKS